jgi:hypothetical protein
LPQRLLDLGRRPHISVPPSCRIGRTSTSPKAASGTRAATSTARSGLSQSSRKKPASSSLASAKGPSLVTVRPCWTQDALGQRRIGEGLRDDQLPRCGELLGEGSVVAKPLGALVVGESLPDLPGCRVAVDQDQVFH